MSVNAIDNSGLINYCYNGCDVAGFKPKATYTYDPSAKKVTVTDASIFPSGSAFKIAHVIVHDNFGNDARGEIESANGNVAVDVSTLNSSEYLNISVTTIGENNLIADGSAWRIGAGGDISNWDAQKNA